MTSPTVTDAQLWTIKQAAELLQVNERTIRRGIAEGRISARRFGPRLLRIDPSSLIAWGRPVQYVEGGDRP